MRTIGITGGAGSGKSFVADIICKAFPILHINTDDVARTQLARGGSSYAGVVEAFGKEILREDLEVDRTKLAGIVFGDYKKLKLLNSLTHPNVTDEVLKTIEHADKGELLCECDGGSRRYIAVLVETAILKEAGYEKFCDDIWYVRAPKEDRMERMIKTRGYSLEKAESVIHSQAEDSVFEAYCTGIIDNPDIFGAEDILRQVKGLLFQPEEY